MYASYYYTSNNLVLYTKRGIIRLDDVRIDTHYYVQKANIFHDDRILQQAFALFVLLQISPFNFLIYEAFQIDIFLFLMKTIIVFFKSNFLLNFITHTHTLKCINCIWYDIMRDWAILHMVTLLNKLKYLDTPGQKLIDCYTLCTNFNYRLQICIRFFLIADWAGTYTVPFCIEIIKIVQKSLTSRGKKGKKIDSSMRVNDAHWYENEISKNITRLSLTNFNVNQEVLNNLSKYLKMEECLVNELVLDRINLSNLNYLCCLTPDTKVKKLWLRFCQLKDKGVHYLLDILDETSRNTQLNSLYLDCNSITCKGAKKLAKVLRTNRTLKSLSLARNLIKDEGAFALVSVLSTFQLNDYETNWKYKQEQQRNRILEYMTDILTQKLKEKTVSSNDSNNNGLSSIEVANLKQRAESMIVPHTHPYLTGQLLKSGLSYYSPGNFKIASLNISYNRFSSNILSIIEQIIQYQQKVCVVKEGLKNLKIEGFDMKQIERINKLIEGNLRQENRNKKFH
ncbi:hypothetical protein QTP88_009287 [Uroleucon formosanum]